MSGLQKVLERVNANRLAKAIGIKPQALTGWKASGRVPAERVLEVERISGVPRHEIRPDLYPPPEHDPQLQPHA